MHFRILSILTFILLIIYNLLVVHIKDVESSYGDTCTQNDTSNCTYPGLKCTPAGRCNCSLGFAGLGPVAVDTTCNMRYLSVPLISTIVSPTAVIFRWEGNSRESGVEYDLLWTPQDGHIVSIDSEGGEVSGLEPDHSYNFTIVSDLSTDHFYNGGKFFGEDIPVCTKSLYGGQCSTCGTCQDVQLVCTEAVDKHSRCLCEDAFFNLTDTGNCTSLNNLLVTNISSIRSTSEVFLQWATSTKLSSVIYQVDWSPSGGEMTSITNTGAYVSALTPAVQYHFSIRSVLPGDAYYSEKSVTSQEYTTRTQYPYLGECFVDVNNDCQTTTLCSRAVDGEFDCLCGPTEYFNDTKGECSSLDDLKVTDVSMIVTAYTVTFTWVTKEQQDTFVNYTLEWTPTGGKLDNISSSGAHVSGLISSTFYNFTIISLQPANAYYPEKSVSVQVSSVMTENDLEVTFISTQVTATAVIFTWVGSNLGLEVSYNLQWLPNEGHIDFINSTGGRVSGLKPDSKYDFIIVSELSGESPVSYRVYVGPNVTICTDSLYGDQCGMCGTCEDNQQICVEALDKQKRCLCNKSSFNLTDSGNCTSLNDLIVTNITITSSTTAVSMTWVAELQLSSVTYKIQVDPPGGLVDRVDSSGGHVSVLTPGNLYYFSIESVVASDSYNNEKAISASLVSIWTDVIYLGLCEPITDKECQDKTECTLANDFFYHCMCEDGYYFDTVKESCSNMDDLKVTILSTTFTATTIIFTWFSNPLPASGGYTVTWSPNNGILDRVSEKGAEISELEPSTAYNFTIITFLPSDHYYQERRVTVQDFCVKTYPSYNGTCDEEGGCQYTQHCLNFSGSYRCQCYSSEYYDILDDRCLPLDALEVSLLSTTVSSTMVTFRWLGSGPESGITYNIEWTPKDGNKDFVNLEGGQVSGLQPDSQYNFTLSGESPYPEKSYYGPNMTICTKSMFGGECGTCGKCQDDFQICARSLDNNTRCLCETSFFNLTDTGDCTSLNKLIVTNITIRRSTTAANITWEQNLLVNSVTYKIHITPNIGQIINVTRTGADISGIYPSSFFYFSVESDLPGDTYENGKNISSSQLGFYTGM